MRSFYIILLAFGFMGCATDQSNNKLDTYKQAYEPLMGKTEEEIVMTKGAPTEIQEAGSIRIYIYRISHGNRSVAMRGFGSNTNVYGSSFESYDQARIYFRDGRAQKWDADWR